jgi:hypothetical protein
MSINRKYLLWIVFVALLLFYGGDWMLQVIRAPMDKALTTNKNLKDKIKKQKGVLKTIRNEKKQLAKWEEQSLPSDSRVARSLYQAWLVRLVEHVGLTKPSVDSGDPVSHRGVFQTISFNLRGQGTFEQATQLLFEFYRAGHLHLIRNLELTPMPDRQFGVSVMIEAVVLSEIKRKDTLCDIQVNRLKSDNLADYTVIAKRNIFATGGDPDLLDYTRLTAVTTAEDRPQAWFSLDLQNETVQKAVGEKLDVGSYHATIVEIDGSDVIVEIDGQRRLLTIGEALSQASALPEGL